MRPAGAARESAPSPPFQIAEVYAARGETDAAFEWLDGASSSTIRALPERRTSAPIRSSAIPRWAAFLNKMGSTDEMGGLTH
jgi:hypothetical protein